MKQKRGLVLFVILGIIGILVIGGIGAGYYFYESYVFKTLRLCIGEETTTEKICEVKQDCFNSLEFSEEEIHSGNYPEFVEDKFVELVDKILRCEETCKVKHVRGIDYENQKVEELESCEAGEEEFLIEIHGKEGLELWNFMKSRQ